MTAVLAATFTIAALIAFSVLALDRNWLAASLFGIAAIVTASIALASEHQGVVHEDRTHNEDASAKQTVSAGQQSDAAKADKKTNNHNHQVHTEAGRPSNDWFNAAIVFFNFLLVVVGFLTVRVYSAQCKVMKGQLVVARDAANASAEAARATTLSVQLASDTAKKQLRAYAFVQGVLLEAKKSLENEHIEATVFLKNFGLTPAYEIMARGKLEVAGASLSGPFHNMNKPFKQLSIAAPLATREIRIQTDWAVTSDELKMIGKGHSAMYCHGEYSYRDAFGRRFKTTFRFFITGDDFVPSGNFIVDKEGNEEIELTPDAPDGK